MSLIMNTHLAMPQNPNGVGSDHHALPCLGSFNEKRIRQLLSLFQGSYDYYSICQTIQITVCSYAWPKSNSIIKNEKKKQKKSLK